MTDIIFGFGHGFGGTHLLAELLNVLPNVDSKHERKGPMSKYAMFDRYMEVFHGDSEAGRKAVLEERVPMVNSVIGSGKIFAEANGILGFFVAPLFQTWPQAKFVYTTRDPRGQVRTAYNTGIFDEGVAKNILKAHPDWDSVWWWPRPASDDSLSEDWQFLSAFEKCAWFWAAYNEFVLMQLQQIPKDRVFIYKFEDMIAGKRAMELYDFLELPRPVESQIQKIVSVKHAQTVARVANPLPKWDQLKPALQKRLLEFVETTMKKLEYEVQ